MSSNRSNLPFHVRQQAGLVNVNWLGGNSPENSPDIQGPALVYTTPALSLCGARHNMEAVRKAAFQLGVPLYVILTAENTDIDTTAKRPAIAGQTQETLITRNQDELMDKYQLFPRDTVIRLVDQTGDLVKMSKTGDLVKMSKVEIPPKNAPTEAGINSLINAFQEPIATLCKTSPTASCGRYGR